MTDPTTEYLAADLVATEEVRVAAHRQHVRHLVDEAVQDGRKLVTVRRIDSVDDIPGADLIKVAQVEGWQVVVRVGEFDVGDRCVFFEVDSFLNLDDPRFAFLEKSAVTWQGVHGARLRTVRLRKTLSQGLALPLGLFPEIEAIVDGLPNEDEVRATNFTGVVGVMKYEPAMGAQLQGLVRGSFPSFLAKSDQERCQNLARNIFGYNDERVPFDPTSVPEDVLTLLAGRGELVWADDDWKKVIPARASRSTRYEVTVKLDGSSMTVYNRVDGEDSLVGVCSRNLDLKLEGNEENAFVKVAQDGILDGLKRLGRSVAIQGELVGPGVQGNREGLPRLEFHVYNVFDIAEGEFMTPVARWQFVSEFNAVADVRLEHVPILHESITLDELGITDVQTLLKFADGPSLRHPVREGLVFKAHGGGQQFKVISNRFLEGEK